MTANFKELEQVRFKLPAHLRGGSRKISTAVSLSLDDETAERIEDLVQEHSTKSPVYGNTIYLKSKNLSEKQKNELYTLCSHRV